MFKVLGIIFIVSISFFYIWAQYFHTPIFSFIVSFVQGFHVTPSLTSCIAPAVQGWHINFYVYIIFIFSTLFIILSEKHFLRPKKIFFVGISLFFIYFSIQSYYYVYDFLRKDVLVSLLSSQEKKKIIFGSPFEFSRLCKSVLKGRHSAKLITDIDLSSSEGMFRHRQLSYFLFPIDIRVKPQYQPIDTYVAFYKKNAAEYIPDGFKIIFERGDNFLLAVKERRN
ncbi:hypothetical protein MNBD_UNCLBAC01-559 [hydrothermal vent metagenome]|uniref:Uncharacterized protein n=1 Tax=hydrothermal vent metagenome TaxID=652676 RepID=A0A3B1DL44_9ZZZZ